MPKRSRTCQEDLDRLLNKVRKLEKKIRERENVNPAVARDHAEQAAAKLAPASPAPPSTLTNHAPTGTYGIEPSDWSQYDLDQVIYDQNYGNSINFQEAFVEDVAETPEANFIGDDNPEPITPPIIVGESSALDADALEILGDDPSLTEKHGKEIIPELASRLQHIATTGISYEMRKDLLSKYLIPSNCSHIDAPKINPEIKAAIPETVAKKEKGLAVKQKQMAHAISCLGEILSNEMNSKNKNKESLQKLMDLARLLCDIQHNDSVTRRNFIIFSLKKDVKEHLSNTKIDSFLFSEALPETLKHAKTINKSITELKANTPAKPKKPVTSSMKPLNRKPPGTAYRPQTQPGRNYQPAAPRTQQPAHSSKTLSRQPAAKTAPLRRRY
ncbi:uncharacterized protein LOC121728997 [Aricia agestis]|uniref:uncharacterized protein LOC121728997 n=1 Tax=Aricia agestis TaxID=91739 RepID=UPI001C20A43C|nr:uncharacterized protein LOC121728997 [Aricia agestis]